MPKRNYPEQYFDPLFLSALHQKMSQANENNTELPVLSDEFLTEEELDA